MPFTSGGRNGRLNQSSQTVIGGDGTATIVLGPTVRGEIWHVERLTVSSSSTSDTECRIYRGSVSETNLIEGTYSGNQDVSNTTVDLETPERLYFVWSTGTVTATVTAIIEGTKSMRTFGY